MRHSETAVFITLTYNEQCQPWTDIYPTLNRDDLTLFLKRLRKHNKKHSKSKIRYYGCGEYGTKTFRPHYHLILFNAHEKTLDNLESIWQQGICHIGECNAATIHYTTKYVINKAHYPAGVVKPFAAMSRRPGIGHQYLSTTLYHRALQQFHTAVNGFIQPLPRYYKDKMFTSFERDVINAKLRKMSDQTYHKEIQRLAQYHNDPASYLEEIQRQAYERIAENKQVTF